MTRLSRQSLDEVHAWDKETGTAGDKIKHLKVGKNDGGRAARRAGWIEKSQL
jgi:hypothetical protein